MYPSSAQITFQQAVFLTEIVSKYNIRSVLEIGTLYGFSAANLANAVGGSGYVMTIERNPENYAIAKENLANYTNVQIVLANAEQYLPTLEKRFDMIFIDANKSKYPNYLIHATRLLCPDGIIIADNTNFRGMVLTNDIPPKRFRALVNGLRKFHQLAAELENFIVTQINMEDGMTIIKQCK